jgi:hypothetical protein
MQAARKTTVVALCFAAMSLSTGLALVVAVLAHVSMGGVLAMLAVFCLLVGLWLRAQATPPVRQILARRARAGMLAGAGAVLAYDSVRLGMVALLHLHVRPLEALPYFGELIAGRGIDARTALAIGTCYHYANGVLFGTSYALFFARAPWWYGIAWGVALEAAMLLVYPQFLSLGKVLAEFTAVSLSGHIAYGAALGLLTRKLASR